MKKTRMRFSGGRALTYSDESETAKRNVTDPRQFKRAAITGGLR